MEVSSSHQHSHDDDDEEERISYNDSSSYLLEIEEDSSNDESSSSSVLICFERIRDLQFMVDCFGSKKWEAAKYIISESVVMRKRRTLFPRSKRFFWEGRNLIPALVQRWCQR